MAPAPIGRWFVYSASEDLGPGPSIHNRLFAIDLDAPASPRVAISLADDRILYAFSVSPDRRRVVYGLRGLSDDRVSIYLVDFSSGRPGPSVVVDDQVGNIFSVDLAWSTDGRRLAYARSRLDPAGSPIWETKVVDMSSTAPGPPVVAERYTDGPIGTVRWINEDVLAYQPATPGLPLRFVSWTAARSWVPTVLQAGVVRLFYVDARPHPPAALVTEGCTGAFIDFAAARIRSVDHGITAAANLTWVAERTPQGTWSIFPGSATVQPLVATLTGGVPDVNSPRCDTGVWSHHGAMFAWIDAAYTVRLSSFDASGTPTTVSVSGFAQATSVQFSSDDRWLLIQGSGTPALASLRDGVASEARAITAPGGRDNVLIDDVAFQYDVAFVFFGGHDIVSGQRTIYRAPLGPTAVGEPQPLFALPVSESVRYFVARDGRTLVYISSEVTGDSKYYAVDLTNTQLPPRLLIPAPECALPDHRCSNLDAWEIVP